LAGRCRCQWPALRSGGGQIHLIQGRISPPSYSRRTVGASRSSRRRPAWLPGSASRLLPDPTLQWPDLVLHTGLPAFCSASSPPAADLDMVNGWSPTGGVHRRRCCALLLVRITNDSSSKVCRARGGRLANAMLKRVVSQRCPWAGTSCGARHRAIRLAALHRRLRLSAVVVVRVRPGRGNAQWWCTLLHRASR
jgi:hypothetical protein